MVNVIEEVVEGRAVVAWSPLIAEHMGIKLRMLVFQDAMKFNNIPALRWDFQPVPKSDRQYTDETFDGVRLPATALQLQQIADLTGCMLLTPKLIDLIWLQAQTRFDPIINTPIPGTSSKRIVASSHLHVVHQAIEKRATGAVGLTACVGKYWCLTNKLHRGGLKPSEGGLLYGYSTACNYGWLSSVGQLSAVTPGLRCWQSPGYRHNHHHWDPSQTIRLVYRKALLDAHGERQLIDLHDVATSEKLFRLISHEPEPLTYLRQYAVPVPEQSVELAHYKPSPELLVA